MAFWTYIMSSSSGTLYIASFDSARSRTAGTRSAQDERKLN